MIISVENFLPLMIRLVLGSLFFFQAYDKLARIGLKSTIQTILQGTQSKKIPDVFTKFSVTVSTFIELIGGLLLVVGLFIPFSEIILGINLIMVAVAFGYLNGLWDMKDHFPRLILLIILMLLPSELDTLSLDFVLSTLK